REPGENTIAVVDRIYEGIEREIPKMKERGDIPAETEVELVNDQSGYIRSAIRNVQYELGIGAILVVLVVGLTLRRFKPSLAVLMVIPLSILVGMLGFYFTGNNINVMTLGGIALAIGAVVNASIVVVENIVRHLDMGKNGTDAARDGASEVAPAVLAGTVTTLAVFIPIIFLTGMIRYLFEPMALAAVLTIGASYVVAMTVVPAFCSRLMTKGRKASSQDPQDKSKDQTENAGLINRLLQFSMRFRVPLIAAVVVLVGCSYLLYDRIGTELFPAVDAGTFELRVKTTPGTRLEETEKLVERIEQTIEEVIPENEIRNIISNIGLPVGKGAGFSTVLSPNTGPDTAFLITNLKQAGRTTSSLEYVERLREVLKERFPQEQFLFVTGGIINATLNKGVPVPINVQVSAGSVAKCRTAAEKVVRKIQDIPGAVDVQIAQALDYPQLDIKVDRTRAALMGLTQRDIAENVVTALSSSAGIAPMIWVDPKTGVDFFIGVQYENNEMESLDQLRNLPLSVNTEDGPTTVPLSNVAKIDRVNMPGEIAHYNIGRVNDVYVNVSGRDLGSVVADVESALKTVEFDEGVSYTLRGPVATMREGAVTLGMGLLTAAILVYLVMMAQFRSVIDPMIIMLAVPLGFSGVLAALYLTDTTLNIQSLIGALMMIGVVVNNSILIVDTANQLMKKGKDPEQAAIEATSIRFRPIVMTSLVLIASMLPLSIELVPGGEAMIPLARAMIGGMLVSTFLTLFIVPCVYSLIKRPEPVTTTESTA
ncbi:MAG TPA: efflux RND transporter permease subunit, partial [Verrucomicrobiales bacterium]|nr:efflux RND transporter permease subunit [Verrucomicrobiales bacterium]